jgi:hypothetical protein
MKLTLSASLAVLLCTMPAVAQAGCVTALQQSANPLDAGHLAFQGVVSDADSYVYLYDVASKTIVADSHAWSDTLVDAHNPSLTSDGRWMVFMARPAYDTPMRIWGWTPRLRRPIDLTTLSGGDTGLYDEDPKFAFDDEHIVFKRDGAIVVMKAAVREKAIRLGPVTVLAPGKRKTSTEASGPVLSASNRFVYFFRHPSGSENLERLTLKHFETVDDLSYDNPPNTETYYPALASDGTLYFARHPLDPVTHDPGHDSIYVVAPGGQVKKAALAAENLCMASPGDVENADPAPAGSGLLVFSSTFGGERYLLYVGNGEGQVWDFSGTPVAAESGDLQGASYVAQ